MWASACESRVELKNALRVVLAHDTHSQLPSHDSRNELPAQLAKLAEFVVLQRHSIQIGWCFINPALQKKGHGHRWKIHIRKASITRVEIIPENDMNQGLQLEWFANLRGKSQVVISMSKLPKHVPYFQSHYIFNLTDVRQVDLDSFPGWDSLRQGHGGYQKWWVPQNGYSLQWKVPLKIGWSRVPAILGHLHILSLSICFGMPPHIGVYVAETVIVFVSEIRSPEKWMLEIKTMTKTSCRLNDWSMEQRPICYQYLTRSTRLDEAPSCSNQECCWLVEHLKCITWFCNLFGRSWAALVRSC